MRAALLAASAGGGSAAETLTELGTFFGLTLDGPRGVATDGTYAYVGCADDDLIAVVDITDPSSMGVDATAATINGAGAVTKDGDYLYVGSYLDIRFAIIDVTSPLSASEEGNTSNSSHLSRPFDVAVDAAAGYAYTANNNNNRFGVVDISTKTAPAASTSLAFNTGAGTAKPTAVAKVGDYCYVVGGTAGLTRFRIAHVSTPTSPAWECELDWAVDASHPGIDCDGSIAVIVGNGILRVIDVTTPSSPTQLGTLSDDAFTTASDVVLDGTKAYVASGASSGTGVGDVSVVDVSNTSSPSIDDTVTTSGSAYARLAKVDDQLVVVHANNRITVVGIS